MSSMPLASPTAVARRAPGVSVTWALATGWLLALILSLYGAEEIALAVRTSTWGAGDPRAQALADALSAAGRATHLSLLHDALEGNAAAAPATPAPAAAPPPAAGPPPSASAPSAPPPVTPPSTPDAARPVGRVLLVGASSIQFHLGIELERVLATGYSGLTVQRLGKLSTGLTRPDVFDWPARLRELCTSFKPDLVIANFGGNDAQAMLLADGSVAKFGAPAWEQTYGERLREVVAIGRRAGARVVLLGMSTTRDPVLTRRMARVNELTEEAARAAGADYLSIWDLGADARGRYQEVAMIGGRPIKTRLADGKHFSRAGAAHVAEQIARRLSVLHPLVPAAAPPQSSADVAETSPPAR
jgi:uncharacterized protein